MCGKCCSQLHKHLGTHADICFECECVRFPTKDSFDPVFSPIFLSCSYVNYCLSFHRSLLHVTSHYAPFFLAQNSYSHKNIHIVHAFVFYCIFPIRLYIFLYSISASLQHLKTPEKKTNRKTFFAPPKLKRDFVFISLCVWAPHLIVLHTFWPSSFRLGSRRYSNNVWLKLPSKWSGTYK